MARGRRSPPDLIKINSFSMPGLGKGLGSLIPDNLKRGAANSVSSPSAGAPAGTPIQSVPVFEAPGERVLQLSPDKIKANRYQPRQVFNHREIEELSASIKQHGILQPLVVSPLPGGEYELIAGERRLRASKILDLKTVPAIVRKAEDQQRLELALIENIQRQDLNVIEEATAYKKLMDEFNLSQEQVAVKVGKSRPAVSNAIRVLGLPVEIRDAVSSQKISAGHARAIAGLNTAQDQIDLFRKIVSEQLNVRDVEREAKKMVVTKHLRKVSFDPITEDMMDNLRQALGTKVAIKKKGEQGTILINFYSEEELNNIVKKITEV